MKWQTFLISAVAGIVVWVLSPWLTGQHEPWDAEGFYYVIALLVAGAATGFLSPRPFWAHYLGGLSGQLLYILLTIGVDPLLLVGVIFLLIYTLLFLAGAAVTAQLRRLVWPRPIPS